MSLRALHAPLKESTGLEFLVVGAINTSQEKAAQPPQACHDSYAEGAPWPSQVRTVTAVRKTNASIKRQPNSPSILASFAGKTHACLRWFIVVGGFLIWSHLAGRDLDLEASKLAPFFGIRPDLSAPLRRAEHYRGADLGKEPRPEPRKEGSVGLASEKLLWRRGPKSRRLCLSIAGEMSASQQQHKRGKTAKGLDATEKVVVAVKASKEIPRTALLWALTHVVQPGDCIMLLVVVSPHSPGRKLWGFPRFAGDCASSHRKSHSGTALEQKQLKHEQKHCIDELQCNIVVMKHCQPKVLRLNLVGSHEEEPQLPSKFDKTKTDIDIKGSQNLGRGPVVTPTSSPELETSFTTTEAGTFSISSSELGTSPIFATVKKEEHTSVKQIRNLDVSTSDSDSESLSHTRTEFQPWMAEVFGNGRPSSKEIQEVSHALDTKARISTAKALLDKFSKLDSKSEIGSLSYRSDLNFSGNVREVISLSRNAPPGPPPLCSICQHKAPVFGKPPRWFSYSELELATGGFSQANFLAEGGFGSVHRGVLPDGQAIAVKQHKLASSQGDQEFCSEVEVLS
ncbi:hypothetical protein BHM03_00025355 [Ensete ventricosum]|nr:hypothetical protein BHM03_00025355 [Ensete ventricosum]